MMNGMRVLRMARGSMEIAVLRRALVLWLLIRVAISGVLLLGGGDPLSLHPRAALIIVAAVGFLSWIDTKRRHEDLLLANLGTSRWSIHSLGIVPALVLELLIGTLHRS